MPISSNSPTASTVTTSLTAISTRGLIKFDGLGFVAQPGRHVGHRPNGGVIEASFKADGAKRGISVRYANTKANFVA